MGGGIAEAWPRTIRQCWRRTMYVQLTYFRSMVFLKDVIVSRKTDGSVLPFDDTAEGSTRPSQHTEEKMVDRSFCFTR